MNAVPRRMRRFTSVVVLALAGALLPTAGAGAVPTDTACGEHMKVAELQARLTAAGTDPETGEQNPLPGDGLTVVKGTVPQTFNAQILDIDYGGIGIDHDLIIAELSGLGIDTDRGVWAGMSGSPVYIGDQLIGAVSYGFTWGPSALAGITPAEEMLEMTTGTTAASAPAAMSLSTQQRTSIAAQTDQSVMAVPGRVPRLQVPLGLNVGGERLRWLQDQARSDNARVMPVAGSGYNVAAAANAVITPGSNFAAALSYGDITAAGTGTTTWTCEGEALAFGHPFFWGGRTSLGLHTARSVAIVTDPSFGSYKMATLGSPVGLVDQDRYTGLHGTLSGAPASTPVTSLTIAEHPDGSKETDEGTTNVTYADYVPFVTFIHGFANIDFLLDRYYSAGSSKLTWTVDMTHADQTYQLQRTNQFSSRYDISIESMIEPWMQLERLASNKFGPVRFDAVSLRAEAVDIQRHFRVKRLEVRRDGMWQRAPTRMVVDPGQTFRVRTVLYRFEGSEHTGTRKEVFWFTVPRRAAGAFGGVSAGNPRGGGEGYEEESSGEEFCFITGECGGGQTSVRTFQALVDKLENAPRNDELKATMSLYSEHGGRWTRADETMMPKTVTGGAFLPLRVRGFSR